MSTKSILDNDYDAISQMPLFRSMSPQQLDDFIRDNRCNIKKLEPGQVVHLEGELCTAAEVIIDGEIAIERITEEGSMMLIARFGTADILGGNLVFASDTSFPLTITCRRECRVLSVQRDLLLELMHNDRIFLLGFLQIISDNTSLLSGKIKQTLNRPLRQRILDYIDQQAALQESKTIKLAITKKEIAETLGVQRTSLSRELRKMKIARLVDYDSETITLLV